VRNLHISHIEVRSEDDLDIAPYTNDKLVETIKCNQFAGASGSGTGSNTSVDMKQLLTSIFRPIVGICNQHQILTCANPAYLNGMIVQEAETLVAQCLCYESVF
jgi:ERCC4-related helicase